MFDLDFATIDNCRSYPGQMTRSMSTATRISIYVQPRAARTAIAGLHDGCIKIRLAAPPVDGAANAALLAFLAEQLGVAKQHVRLIAGHASRRKVIEVDGLSLAAVQAALR
jgi:uncharacterized protein